MKEKFYLILIVILIAGLAVTGFFGYVGPAIYAKDKAEEFQEMLEISESQEEIRDFREEAEKKYKEEAEKNIKTLKRVHKAIAERTSECKQTLDSMIFTLQSLAKQARENGQIEKEKELLLVLIDYNSVKGDLDAIAVLLKMAEFVEDEEFIRYFELISQGYEYFKDDFNLKNELFLERISQLKDKDTLRFEKKLYGVFCKYFEYDLWQDRQAWTEPEDESQKGKGEGEAE